MISINRKQLAFSLIALLFFASFIFSFKPFAGGEPKGKQQFCFSDEVSDTSKRFSNFLLQIDYGKRTFQYEVITQSLSANSKWVNYSFSAGKIKKKDESVFVLNSALHTEKTKSAGRVFSEKKHDAPAKLIFNQKNLSLVNEDKRITINMYKCKNFPKDSLRLFFDRWKN